MSYLRRLARETTTPFRPRRAAWSPLQTGFRVEETYVEARQPPSQLETRASLPRAEFPVGPVAPSVLRVTPSDDMPKGATPRVLEVRREFPDSIEDTVVFDPQSATLESSPSQATPSAPSGSRERPDPRQAESVLARLRALMANSPQADVRTIATEPAGMEQSSGLRSDAESAPRAAEIFSPIARAASMLEQSHTAVPPRTDVRQAEPVPRSTPPPQQESTLTRPAPRVYTADGPATARRSESKDTTYLNIGSIVVHVEPETPQPTAPPVQVRTPRASGHTESTDSRWARSFLDRN